MRRLFLLLPAAALIALPQIAGSHPAGHALSEG